MLNPLHKIVYLLVYLVAILPRWLKWAVSLKLYIIVFYLLGYRKKTVLQNLSLSFPKKTSADLKNLRRKFYHQFIEVFIDAITPLVWTREQMNTHYCIDNIDLLEKHLRERSVLLMAGHYANWDWTVSIGNHIEEPAYVVYQPVKSDFYDKLIHKIRSKSNSTMLPSGQVAKAVLFNVKSGKKAVYTLVADQSPLLSQTKLWLPFMGVEVPVHTGAESLAVKADMAVLYIKTRKVKSGYYAIEFEEITASAAKENMFDITKKFISLLEEQIRNRPELYLWSHRRWKHAGKKP